MSSERIGSSFEDFLNNEGIRDEVDSVAQKRVFAWQIQHAMEASGMTQWNRVGDALRAIFYGARLFRLIVRTFWNGLDCE